ncbi:MAG TPA: nucleoside triphosphate pyrophosphohydrolase [Virgibacillus sp.]|nr:nucleoside triphosphate pyrophosphohydrolase [Virgibacillus sp.]
MGQIEIVGLGAGTLNQLPLGIYKKIIRTEKPVYVRTLDHPVIRQLQSEGVTFSSFDVTYETYERFEEVYREIVSDLLAASETESIMYAVPGHPMLAESTVKLLLEQTEREVKIAGGQSYLDDLFTTLEIDPIDGFQFIDATGFDRNQLNFRNHLIFSQIYDAFTASNVKLTLLEDLPADYRVTIVEAAGTDNEDVRVIALEDLDRSMEISNLTTLYVPPVPPTLQNHTFTRLREIIAALRAPDGCPWDRVQTHESLREHAIEEVYEFVEAVDEEDDEGMIEELGDVLLQVMLHSQIGEDDGYFSVEDVIQTLTEKMIHRHPHVFKDIVVDSVDDVYKNWDELKKEEKGATRTSIFDGIPKHLPSLLKSYKVQKKVAKETAEMGIDRLWETIDEKLTLLRSLDVDPGDIEPILGQLLFEVVHLSRYHEINPELALSQAVNRYMEKYEKQ